MKHRVLLENVSFAFDNNSKFFFKDIGFAIEDCRLTFLIGKNGAGKSTLFRILQGLIDPKEKVCGKIHINGVSYDLAKIKDRDILQNKTMLLHQNFDAMLAPSFTGFENIRFAQFGNYPGFSKVQCIEEFVGLAQQFNIPLDRQVGLLSGGQRQMLALLMAAQKNIDLLLLDEPTSALDSKNSHFMMQGIKQLIQDKGLSVLCISHDQELIVEYSNHALEVFVNDSGIREFLLY